MVRITRSVSVFPLGFDQVVNICLIIITAQFIMKRSDAGRQPLFEMRSAAFGPPEENNCVPLELNPKDSCQGLDLFIPAWQDRRTCMENSVYFPAPSLYNRA
jgi:hypothetical protein